MGKKESADVTLNAYLGLGTNLGDRKENLKAAVRLLTDCDEVELCGAASIYETSPVGGPPGQSDYLNTVIAVDSRLDVRTLLNHILSVERSMGRVRNEVNGPRNIDIDLLLSGGDVIDTPSLSVPHPRMHVRRFVLEPLAELAPDLRHPLIDKTIQELLYELPKEEEFVRQVASAGWQSETTAGQ
ncbi:MAG: 2-amino-4-hydroxy-6-hydroxymethyldihydropteridine diphosphokinase [Phycisphaerae bacterium]|nr:MAG: 2-amino-4-hydroxy-6-hydroxymethyldihydropteridine diphosphokinase [Phycisphaerae bacterium]